MISHLLIDFDSTFTKVEALEELADITLAGRPDKARITGEIRALTDAAMEGRMPYAKSLARRLSLLNAHERHLAPLVERLRGKISGSIERNREFFLRRSIPCYIISSGFREFIEPVVAEFGFDSPHVLANEFSYAPDRSIIGCNESNPLSQDRGKVREVEKLRLRGDVFLLGDGYTDFEIREAGLATRFFAFTENVARPMVVNRADDVVASFDEFLAKAGLP